MDDADGCAIAEATEVATEPTDWTAPAGLGMVAAGAGVSDGAVGAAGAEVPVGAVRAAGAVGLVLGAVGWVTAVTAGWVTEPRAWTAPLGLGLAEAGASAAWPLTGEGEEGDAELVAAGCVAASAGAVAPEVSVAPAA